MAAQFPAPRNLGQIAEDGRQIMQLGLLFVVVQLREGLCQAGQRVIVSFQRVQDLVDQRFHSR